MARVISVTSGKGGVGKSTLSVSLGVAYASMEKKVLVIEFDLGLRGVDIMLGLSDKIVFDLGDLLEGRCNINKAIVESDWNPCLNLIAAPTSMKGRIDLSDIALLIEGLRPYFDVIILDTPAGIRFSLGVAALADLVLIVATPDPICIRDGRQVTDALARKGITEHRLVINRVDRKMIRKQIVTDLDEVIDGVGSQLIGVLPEEPQLQLCAAKGIPLEESRSIVRICRAISLRIEGEYIPLLIG